MSLSRPQFVQRVLEIVKAKFPLEKIAAAEQPFSLSINGNVASLENLYRLAQLEPKTLRRQAERWIVELLRAADAPDTTANFSEVTDRVYPMILPEAGSLASGAFTRPLAPGLVIAYAVDNDRTIAYVSSQRFQQWGIGAEELHELALANLSARSAEINAHAAQDEEGRVNLMLFQTMDGYDSSRLLLPTLYQRLREYLGSPFAAAIPNRDILLCFRDDEQTVNRIRAQVAADYKRMPHQITDKLLLITLDGIAPRD
ncbi:MAG: DUF1444 family protein [Tepidisphaeraceae bacterium]|jgi:uncharacterized protein DUF1444